MEINRKPFQGVLNIIRFNWHIYVIAAIGLALCYNLNYLLPVQLQAFTPYLIVLFVSQIGISLIISFYIYDCSNLYTLSWLQYTEPAHVLNINAGFDEISEILTDKFKNANLTICDFYDKAKHTEVSIKRARAAYPPPADTIQVSTTELPFKDGTFDCTLAFLAAHEIRDKTERAQFFLELNRITKPSGAIYVTEHIRDLNNLIAFNIGFYHFHTKQTWKETFEKANLIIECEQKTTPFVTTFKLRKHAPTLCIYRPDISLSGSDSRDIP